MESEENGTKQYTCVKKKYHETQVLLCQNKVKSESLWSTIMRSSLLIPLLDKRMQRREDRLYREYICARNGTSLRVFNSISHELALRTNEMSC